MLSKAGLSKTRCEVILGGAQTAVDFLEGVHQRCVDIIFIDHDKSLYLSDLKLFETAGLLQTGSKVIADNILSFNRPLDIYLDHVRGSGLYSSSECYHSLVEYTVDGETTLDLDGQTITDMLDGVEVSIFG